MNKLEIKRKIAELIGLSSYKFGSYKTSEGTEFKVEKMEVGMPIYVITPEGELPVPEGEYEMEAGMKVKVKEGMISEIKDADTSTEENVEMAEATLVDGTKVEVEGDFEVGKPLFVITEAGERVPAPEGEHTTESGIVVVVDAEGIITGITRPDEAPEGSLEAAKEISMEELVDEFASVVKKLMAEIDGMKKSQEEMNQKFSKFAAEPAGEKVFDRKGYLAERENHKFSKLEAISKIKGKK